MPTTTVAKCHKQFVIDSLTIDIVKGLAATVGKPECYLVEEAIGEYLAGRCAVISPKPDSPKKKQYVLTSGLAEKLEAYSQQSGIMQSRIAESALQQYIKKHRHDAIARLEKSLLN